MNETAKAYIAAMVDAEGVISLGRRKGTGKRSAHGREWHVTIRVIVTNSHSGMLGLLQRLTGVGVLYEHKAATRDNWSVIHRWQVTGKQARDLIREIRPYLIVKADMADLILGMPMQSKGGKRAEDQAIYAEQMACWERSRSMNARGIKRDVDWHSVSESHPLIALLASQHPTQPS